MVVEASYVTQASSTGLIPLELQLVLSTDPHFDHAAVSKRSSPAFCVNHVIRFTLSPQLTGQRRSEPVSVIEQVVSSEETGRDL